MPQSNSFTFDLVSEPWIPCEELDGTRVELGIRDTFARAHELAAVSDESPLVTAILHRLLLAILDRALQPTDRDAWLALWRADRLPMDAIDRYLEAWRHRLDLFHAERPFMQVAALEAEFTKERGKPPERMPAWRMTIESSFCGGHVQLFEPMPPSAALSCAAAARALLAYQAYTSGGRINNEAESWKGGNLRAAAVTLVRGDCLHQTLILNTVLRRQRPAGDVPPWERARDIARLVRAPCGPVDLLLWPSRRMCLLPASGAEGDVHVVDVIAAAGERMDVDAYDSQGAFFLRSEKDPPVALRFDPDRSVWRDATALFEGPATTAKSRSFRRPDAVNQLSELIADGCIADRNLRFSFEILGMSTDKAVIRISRRERWSVPPRLLTDGDRVDVLRDALSSADEVARGLERHALFALCGRALSSGDREAHKDDVQRLRDSLAVMPSYWSELGREFEPWLAALGTIETPEDALPPWRTSVRVAADRAFRSAARKLGTSARAFQAVAAGEQALRRVLFEHLGAPIHAGMTARTVTVETRHS